VRAGWAAASAAALLLAAVGCDPGPAAQPPRCRLIEQRYGLVPCPPDPLPVESVSVKNLDPKLTDAQARRIAEAYLRSRALYHLAVQANSDRFFTADVIDLHEVSPLMFEAETAHIRDARDRHGQLVPLSRSTLTSLKIVALPADLKEGLDVTPLPMDDAIVVEATGPEQQVIRVPGRPDEPVSTLEAGDSVHILIGGILVTRDGLPETFAELGQWECLDPDTHGTCQLPPSGT
jgi:hypothetical protein